MTSDGMTSVDEIVKLQQELLSHQSNQKQLQRETIKLLSALNKNLNFMSDRLDEFAIRTNIKLNDLQANNTGNITVSGNSLTQTADADATAVSAPLVVEPALATSTTNTCNKLPVGPPASSSPLLISSMNNNNNNIVNNMNNGNVSTSSTRNGSKSVDTNNNNFKTYNRNQKVKEYFQSNDQDNEVTSALDNKLNAFNVKLNTSINNSNNNASSSPTSTTTKQPQQLSGRSSSRTISNLTKMTATTTRTTVAALQRPNKLLDVS